MTRASVRWVLGASGVAVLLFALLVPRARPEVEWWEWEWRAVPELQTPARLRRQAWIDRWDLEQRLVRADSRELAHAMAERARGPLSVLAASGVPEPARTRLEATARAELSALDISIPRHPIVITVAVDSSTNDAYLYRRTTVLPTAPGAPCIVIVRVLTRRASALDISPEDRLLGPCAFHAVYGTPGAGMQRWLLETRAMTAEYLHIPASLAEDTTLMSLSDYSTREWWVLKGCRAGVSKYCDALFTPARQTVAEYGTGSESVADAMWTYPDVSIRGPGEISGSHSAVSAGLLAALAKDLGPRRFEAIWTSDRPPAEAFERPEGRSLAAWVMDYVRPRVEPYAPGPGVGVRRALLACVIVAAGLALAATRSRRRLS